MNKKTLIIIILLVLAFIAGFLVNRFVFTGQAIANTNQNIEQQVTTQTKALCKNNQCVDVLITKQGDEITNLKVASDVIEFPDNWQDPRG